MTFFSSGLICQVCFRKITKGCNGVIVFLPGSSWVVGSIITKQLNFSVLLISVWALIWGF